MPMSKIDFEKHCREFDQLAERIALGLAEYEEKYGKPPADFRTQVFQAAERANKRFGQWMPTQWLEIFIGEMMVSPDDPPANTQMKADWFLYPVNKDDM